MRAMPRRAVAVPLPALCDVSVARAGSSVV
jgi:hypothetical protein